MNEQFFDCLKRERDIRIKPKLRDGKTAFMSEPHLIKLSFWHENEAGLYKQDFHGLVITFIKTNILVWSQFYNKHFANSIKPIKACHVTGHVTLNMLKTHLESIDYFSFTFIHNICLSL